MLRTEITDKDRNEMDDCKTRIDSLVESWRKPALTVIKGGKTDDGDQTKKNGKTKDELLDDILHGLRELSRVKREYNERQGVRK